MNLRLLLLLPLLTVPLLGSACSGEEAAAGAAVREFFARAQNGEIERALELVIPEHPTAQLLASLRKEDPRRYKETVAGLGKDMKKRLEGARFHILSIKLDGGRAVVKLVILRESAEEENSIVAVKRAGKWLLESLPTISAME